jgi:hypothetical protein
MTIVYVTSHYERPKLEASVPRLLQLLFDGWRVVDNDYGQAVGKLQAESMMSTAASLFHQ